jgi:hypothetical protein
MIKRVYRSIGERTIFITVTTRQASFAPVYFGKFTFWKSKEHYDRGDCDGAHTYTGIYLGDCELNLEVAINCSIDKIIKRGELI